MKLETKQVPILRPLTRKRTVFVSFQSKPSVSTHGTWWDGGSKNEYSVINLVNGANSHVGAPSSPFSGGPSSVDVACGPLSGVLQTGWFCGKAATLHLHLCDYGSETLRLLLIGAIKGETPWYVVRDCYRELGLDVPGEKAATAGV